MTVLAEPLSRQRLGPLVLKLLPGFCSPADGGDPPVVFWVAFFVVPARFGFGVLEVEGSETQAQFGLYGILENGVADTGCACQIG